MHTRHPTGGAVDGEPEFVQRCKACGRNAERPRQIPIAGWRDILMRVADELDHDNITVLAAGVAFFTLLASVPALAAVVSLYGLVAEPSDVAMQVARVGPLLPASSRRLLYAALHRLVLQSTGTLGAGAVLGLAVSLWTSSRGTQALLRAVNIAYKEERNRRGLVAEIGFSVAVTAVAIAGTLLVGGLVVVVPAVLAALGLGDRTAGALALLRWPLLLVLFSFAFAALYRHGPRRRRPKWRWVFPGALLATALWVASSMLLSAYVSHFGSYDKTYGSIGAAIILLLWLFITTYVVLLGAEFNAEMEHQTRQDTTVGSPRPMGERGAYVADHLGRCRPLPNLPESVRKSMSDFSRRGEAVFGAKRRRQRTARPARPDDASTRRRPEP